MVLKKLGFYQKPQRKTRHNLSEYAVDKEGTVYSSNDGTYFTRYGKDIRESEGKARTVTLRDDFGNKVSIERSKLRQAFLYNKTLNF